MVCIAAFIILCLVGIVVAFLSIFKKEIGKKYLAVFKKAWHCVFKKVRLQKCDTNFKDDVKNTILKKVILKKPKLVKPLSVIIEIVSVLIVIITIWSLIIAIKSLLALWVFGTCNVSKPSACSLTSESCSIDEAEATNIFEQIGQNIGEWGEIFAGIPDRLKTWNEDDFKNIKFMAKVGNENAEKTAIDIMDLGCIVCLKSYNNQKNSGFLDSYNTKVVFYAIKNADGTYRFKNSGISTRYFYAVMKLQDKYTVKMLDRLFTEKDENGVNFQTRLNNDWSEEETVNIFSSWLKEFGASDAEIEEIKNSANSTEIKEAVENDHKVIDEEIKAKSIPTLIYDGGKHAGLYKDN